MFRRAVFLVHLGLVSVLLGLSGSLLVFRHEIDAALQPDLFKVEPQSTKVNLAIIADRVERAYPNIQIGTIDVPGENDRAIQFWMKRGSMRVHADPYSGRLLGEREADASFMGWLFQVHTKLFIGEAGEKVAGFSGLALVLLSISGLVVWWPRKNQRFRDGLHIKSTKSAKRFNYDLHRSVGFWACGFLGLIGLSGAALVFPDQAKAVAYGVLSRDQAPTKPKLTSGRISKPLSELLQAANAAMPEGEVARVVLPGKPTDPLIVRKRTSNELHPNGMNYIYVDPQSGNVLRVDRDSGKNPALIVMNLRYPVHIGRYAGTASRLLHVMAGLCPLLLAITGFRIWRTRTLGKRRRLTA